MAVKYALINNDGNILMFVNANESGLENLLELLIPNTRAIFLKNVIK